MRAPRFDRSDFVLTKGLLVLLALGLPALTVGGPLVAWWRGRPLTWELDGLSATLVPPDLRPSSGVRLSGTGTVGVSIPSAATSTWLASLLPGLALSATGLVIAWQLLRVVRRIEQRRAFVASTASAFRVIALALFLGSLVLAVAQGVADAQISQRALSMGDFEVTVPLLPSVGALLVLALAEAFGQGARLQDDVEGLV